VSPGFGAGWSTWADGAAAKFALTYAPFIEYLEANPGASLPEDEDDPLVAKFREDLAAAVGEEEAPYFYIGGIDDLVVVDVDGPFVIDEYDGHESVRTPTSHDWYTPDDF
jgi:hypothetical protein